MSERIRRLTDDEVKAKWEAGHRLMLCADHLQAREDVKRLADRLRERIGGRCCEGARRQCEACAADETLLSEVGQ